MSHGAARFLINYANDLFYYKFASDLAIRLTNDADEEFVEEFGPDGKMVSFVRNNNIHVVDIATRRERPLTRDGNPKLFNGRLDWVYQEELYGRGNFKGYWWSPDASKIVYLQLDESKVNGYTIVDHVPNQPEPEVYSYPKSGTSNPAAKLGVVNVSGGLTRWIDLSVYQAVEPLIPRVSWKPDGKKVVFSISNREQTWMDLNFADPMTGKAVTAFRETSGPWVNADDDHGPYWLKDGSFLWSSERTGWNHLYHYTADCRQHRAVTSGKWEARALHGVDEANGWVYFSGTEHSHIGGDIYRIKLEGGGLQRLTEAPGTHGAKFNPSLSHFIDTWSDVTTPPQVRLYSSDAKLVRVIDENKVAAFSEYKLSKPEFLQVKTRDGFVMEAVMIKPPDFDPNKKYPVFQHTYSGPHAPHNPSGYEKSSVVKAAGNLNGRMLLIHGEIDDNVHIQNSIQFIYALQRAGRRFEFMVYPRSRHAFSDPLLIRHMREMMLRFILENL
jgi:dipeptidyl-peptidase-4